MAKIKYCPTCNGRLAALAHRSETKTWTRYRTPTGATLYRCQDHGLYTDRGEEDADQVFPVKA